MGAVLPILAVAGTIGAGVATGGAALPIASAALTGLGAIASYQGTMAAGRAQQRAASYQSQVAANNATIATQNAAYAGQAGQAQVAQQEAKSRLMAGAIISGQAANGIDVNSGSAVDVQQTQRETASLDAQQTQMNAALQAYGYRAQATSYNAQSGLDAMQAKDAVPGAQLAATGGLVSSAGSLGQNWTRMQQLTEDTTGSGGAESGLWDS